MNIYELSVGDLPANLRGRVTVVKDAESLNRQVAEEFADLLAEKQAKGEMLTVICPVGPLDYRHFAEAVKERKLSCRSLRTINMDEYLDDRDQFIPLSSPLSFHRFMDETFFSLIDRKSRPLPENIVFPDPANPQRTIELIDSIGGADICWAGLGITGHVAFNEPPKMLGEPNDLESFRNCKTRKITISPMSTAQMAMGGTNGNLEILPTRAVTLGMYELLKSKKFRFVFMRNWHAGLWRRALLGPVTSDFPGSLLQTHPNLTVTMTELAAGVPMVNTAQARGDER
jgi:glucosamine-6-phosphate deaminase